MISKTAQQIAIRNFRWEDLPAATEARRQTTLHDNDDRLVSQDEFRHELETPDYDPLHDAFVAVAPSGEIAGFCDGEVDMDNRRAYGYGFVVPDQRRQGIGAHLLEASDARLTEQIVATGDLTGAFIQRNANAVNEGANVLLIASGYQVTRYFYRMFIDLDGAPGPTPLPEGIVLRDVDGERDLETVYRADQEAFADHWGFTPAPYSEWKHYLVDDGHFDPALWRIAWDGDQIAGVCLAHVIAVPDETGWVRHLAVRRPWRKRGLGLALLTDMFAIFKGRGLARAGLGVDAASTTNAVGLYERAGMHVGLKFVSYRKPLANL
ncbi:MAG: GNAT family N-acetyltransferase [Anaerolineae bacterium]|nr:GNAT family N-acetyltransferase [Anaerolineae bacterium]